jgi:hypothetical protein
MSNPQIDALRLGRRSSRSLRLIMVALLVGVLLARVVYISLFAEDLPFWDQWDGEADRLLRPWVEGNLHFLTLFDPHNEHRIFFSRVLVLTLFALNNDQWDNLVEVYANAILYVAMLAMLYTRLCGHETRTSIRTLFPIVIFAVALQPFGWENTLAGFQSQFYFMAIVAIAMIAVAVYHPASRRAFWILLLLSCMSLFTMASGVLACAPVVAVVILRHWRDRSSPKYVIAIFTIMALIAAVGFALIPDLPYHAPLKATGVREHLNAVLTALMWPLQSFGVANWSIRRCMVGVLVMWLPSLIWLIQFARRRKASNTELFAAGMALWVVLQAVAIAHSRGHDMTALASRYMDISAIGLLINAWFAFEILPLPLNISFASLRIYAAAAAFFLIASYGLVIRFKADWSGMSGRHELVLIQTANVRDYVRTKDFSYLDQPLLHIPYPKPDRLRQFLDNPTIAAMLPTSVREPLPLASDVHEQGFYLGGTPDPLSDPPGLTTYGSYPKDTRSIRIARYEGPVLHTAFPYVKMAITTGSKDIQGSQLTVAKGPPTTELEEQVSLDRSLYPSWKDRYVATPAAGFQLKAITTNKTHWFAFSAPVESGRLSMYAHRLQDAVRNLVGLTEHASPLSFRHLESSAESPFGTEGGASAPNVNNLARHANCALDILNNKLVSTDALVPPHDPLSIQGWIANSNNQAPSQFDLLLVNGPDIYGVKAESGLSRPDVAKALHSDAANTAGFNILAQSNNITPGAYRIVVRLNNDGKLETCDTMKSVIIGNAKLQ